MRQPEEIKKGLECCTDPECVCDERCPYMDIKFPKCREQLLTDAHVFVQHLEVQNDTLTAKATLFDTAVEQAEKYKAQVPRWVSAKEPPKEWRKNSKEKVLINYLVYMPEYGIDVGNWIEPAGKWVVMGIPANVTHYMPMPEGPKEG